MYRNQNDYIAIFVISGAIASIFSRNMVVVLSMAMVFTWMVQWSRKMGGFREGMEDASGIDDSTSNEGETILVASESSTPNLDTVQSSSASASASLSPSNLPTATTVATSAVPTLEPDAPPTAVERKLDDLQIKLDTIQSEIYEIKNRSQTN
jgi:hypothetical protein